jgi:hypothetical protein
VTNRSDKRSFLGHWHTTMWGAIGCIFGWVVVSSAPDQWSGLPSTLVFLSVPTQPVQMPPTDTGSWKRLETESSPLQSSALTIKRQIETAKYDPDTSVVAINRFAENPDNNADINSEQKYLHYLGTNSPGESGNDPHLKLGLDQEEAGNKPRLAVRFIIPFGN